MKRRVFHPGGRRRIHGSACAAVLLGWLGVMTLPAVAQGAVSFPVKAAGNGRYLVDQGGVPFFMVGDAAQSAAGALTLAQFQSYLDTRVSQGFNTINVNFIEHKYSPSPPADRSGNAPFTTPGNFGTPNDAYFAGLEQKVAYAASKGVMASLTFYVSAGDHSEGWYNELTSGANTQAVCNALGQYLANGHGSFGGLKQYANVMWTWGADWSFAGDTEALNRLHQLAKGLKDAGSTQLMSGDWGIPASGQGLASYQTGFRTYMDLESVYAYENSGDIAATSRNGYSYVPNSAGSDGRSLTALPTYMKETGYEGESNPSGTAAAVRTYGWNSILNGCTAGYWYGHRDMWDFAFATSGYGGAGLFPPYTAWTTSITSAGAQDLARFAALWSGLDWWKLVPSGTAAPFIGRTLVTSGSAVAAQGSDGKLLLAYVPSTGSGTQAVTVDPRGMAGTARARWWNPKSGAFTDAGSVANTGTASFTTPGSNGDGNDWLLVLDVAGTGTLSIAPTSATVAPGGSATFSASGGSGTGYTWSVAVNASGGSITAGGAYTAGSSGGVSDTVKVVDSLGGAATAVVTVTAPTTLVVSPSAASVAPRATRTFVATGGSGTGYVWSLSVNASGGSIAAGGAYTAGSTGGVSDTVKVVDSLGGAGTAVVTVTAGVSVSPASASVAPRGTRTFTASGGSGTGYAWSLSTNASGATITAGGVYTAGTNGSVTDTVKVVDSLGNVGTAAVTVAPLPAVAIAPSTASVSPRGAQTFTASGGTGTGYAWSLAVNESSGSISPAGVYLAGSVSSVTDTVKVTDSGGKTATAAVAVTAGVFITPATAAVKSRGTRSFTASGGSGVGYVWSLAVNASGGSITAAGLYTAGATANVTDTVTVTDSLANVGTAVVTVAPRKKRRTFGSTVRGG